MSAVMSIGTEKVGARIYVVGNTFPIKSQLKSAGCHWDGDRKQWWIGAAKASQIESLVGGMDGKTIEPDKKELADRQCTGKVEYKGRTYYVIGRSDKTGKLWLTVLDCSIDFWAAESDCKWVKRYEAREERGNYGRSTGRMVYQTVGGIRRFIEKSKRDESTVKNGGVRATYYCGKNTPKAIVLERLMVANGNPSARSLSSSATAIATQEFRGAKIALSLPICCGKWHVTSR